MLNVDQLSQQIAAYADGNLSLNTFEDWFRDQSRNVHLWGDQNVNDFVDAVESLFSERQFERLSDQSMRDKLQQAAREFCRPFVSRAERGLVVFRERSARPLAATAAAAVIVLSMTPPAEVVGSVVEKHSAVSVVAEASSETASSSSLLLVSAQQK